MSSIPPEPYEPEAVEGEQFASSKTIQIIDILRDVNYEQYPSRAIAET